MLTDFLIEKVFHISHTDQFSGYKYCTDGTSGLKIYTAIKIIFMYINVLKI